MTHPTTQGQAAAEAPLKRFLFSYGVKAASGSQTFYVDASTLEEAKAILEDEGGEIYANEVEVTDLSDPEFCGETTLDDFGDYEPPSSHPTPSAQPQASFGIPLCGGPLCSVAEHHPLCKEFAHPAPAAQPVVTASTPAGQAQEALRKACLRALAALEAVTSTHMRPSLHRDAIKGMRAALQQLEQGGE